MLKPQTRVELDVAKCQHNQTGPGVQGSPDVTVNKFPAMRETDKGTYYCAGIEWTVAKGSTTVYINDLPAARMEDPTIHDCGSGNIMTGSDNVLVGG